MKQYINNTLITLLFVLTMHTAIAGDLKKIDQKFRPECYSKYVKIGANTLSPNETQKLIIDDTIDVMTQANYFLPFKEYKEKNIVQSNSYKNFDFLNDNNKQTFIEVDSRSSKEFIIELEKSAVSGKFNFIMDIESRFYNTNIYISNDGINYNKVSANNIEDFSFKHFKMKFTPLGDNNIEEIIRIRELSFYDNSHTYLVTSFSNAHHIEIFSGFICNETPPTYNNTIKDFPIDTDTKEIFLEYLKNPKINIFKGIDSDNDWVDDTIDNCVNIYNPKQEDTTGNGQGDACSDNDNDAIDGFYDNCPEVYNPTQKDINQNSVGDVCEFDTDNDSIPDGIDNCIHLSNPGQDDDDTDNIGNACDNCSAFNPNQLDANNNEIGDVCEAIEKNIIQNDNDNDRVINTEDNCPNISNINQADTDRDGIGDACDNCKELQNPLQIDRLENNIGDLCEDADADGFLGYRDNCMHIHNPAQQDTDNDGIGNICEDDDGDMIVFKNDNCPYQYNKEQKDTDHDGIGDQCDDKDDRFLENNKVFSISILLFFSFIFIVGIIAMVRKINKK